MSNNKKNPSKNNNPEVPNAKQSNLSDESPINQFLTSIDSKPFAEMRPITEGFSLNNNPKKPE